MARPSPELLVSQYVDGFQIPVMFPTDAFRSAMQYKPKPDDLFLVTYPKCGTTWAQQILLLILRQGKPLECPFEFSLSTPFMDTRGAESAEMMPRPNAIKTHLPFHLVPWSEQAKYIYIARNPKDCCVSYFHHTKGIPKHGFKGDFDQYFELFLQGIVDYGDYFDHLMEWFQHRNDPNVLFMTYEEIQEDIEAAVLKMASFIDDEKYAEPLRKDREILDNVIHYSSFKAMKEAALKRAEVIRSMTDEEIQNSPLPEREKRRLFRMRDPKADDKIRNSPPTLHNIRKGIVGDWRNYFSENQSKRMKDKFAERAKGTELENFWQNYIR
ncbi:sulfotransferase 1C2 [Caerostris darwini]|uniref:Sulfotransferase 1C2 n=1 Tax=Caerostris darwini TaxID=1538125 RepID=A0AAV4WMP4_9ARAC|nr:sulfotransferase 1C2 [Caerostris darwini]